MTQPIEIEVKCQVAGRFTLVRRKTATDEVVEEIGPFDNLITNLGLNYIGTNGAMSDCAVGSGTSAPSVNDTALQGFVASTNQIVQLTQSRLSTTPYWTEQSRLYRFNPGSATGNLSEIGVGWNDGAFKTWSRARILDGAGNPTTITVLADEYLEAIYTIRYYPPLNTVTYNVTINGTVYQFQTRASSITSAYISGDFKVTGVWSISVFGGPDTKLGSVLEAPLDYTYADALASANDTIYVNNSKRASSVSTSTIDQGNMPGGIKAMLTGVGYGNSFFQIYFQHLITPPLPKTNQVGLTLNFSFTWDRYTP